MNLIGSHEPYYQKYALKLLDYFPKTTIIPTITMLLYVHKRLTTQYKRVPQIFEQLHRYKLLGNPIKVHSSRIRASIFVGQKVYYIGSHYRKDVKVTQNECYFLIETQFFFYNFLLLTAR